MSREGCCEKTIRKERPNISWERLGSVLGRLGGCPGTSRVLSREFRELVGSVAERPGASWSAPEASRPILMGGADVPQGEQQKRQARPTLRYRQRNFNCHIHVDPTSATLSRPLLDPYRSLSLPLLLAIEVLGGRCVNKTEITTPAQLRQPNSNLNLFSH